ncbi:GTPase ERA-like, chloroplastic [Ricinus communis]|uniref:GTP-binding protein era, putative n=1 Tax=Ricinus communis TaxID=3988 RepID=B9S6C9_RICCO|nr:GTPase ERA-like, chloroplastic [Ricinus communis]EEF40819.1 GTP-binding protein era, putative [Ricinus communis]|eukprot:XP_002521548.1 GTPase ERA-like, chloroplastic [Ricinus communis]
MELSARTLKKQAPIMELALRLSPILPPNKLKISTSSYLSRSCSTTNLFRRRIRTSRRRRSEFGFQVKNNTNTVFFLSNDQQLQKKQQHILVSEGEFDDDDEEEEEEEEEETNTLSLSVKPERNMALLDDYELEELDYASDPNHRSGYVAVVGKPNVGKSTLSNQMIGQKLSIVTDKPQTTRHRILGICSGPDYQMVLYDTPGVIQKQMHKLDSMMMKNVRNAAINADCVLVIVDACKVPEKIDEVLEEGVGSLKDKPPILLVLNKKDLIKPGEIAKKLEWYEKFTDVDEVIPVSAKYGHGVEDIKDWILSKLPFGPAYYPKDIVSEHPERFFVAEIVREKIFMQFRNEVPYACQVNVVSYKSRPTAKDFIQMEIVVEKNSQKIIIIGKEGRALKLLATASRLDIEDFLQKKVYLEIEVKVKDNWRQDEGLLNYYGYGGKIRAL